MNRGEGVVKSVGSEVGAAVKRFLLKGPRKRVALGKSLGEKWGYTQSSIY